MLISWNYTKLFKATKKGCSCRCVSWKRVIPWVCGQWSCTVILQWLHYNTILQWFFQESICSNKDMNVGVRQITSTFSDQTKAEKGEPVETCKLFGLKLLIYILICHILTNQEEFDLLSFQRYWFFKKEVQWNWVLIALYLTVLFAPCDFFIHAALLFYTVHSTSTHVLM